MMELLREVQIPFLAILLLSASAAKAFWRQDRTAVAHLGVRYAMTVALTEAALGLLLLVTALGAVRLAAIVFFATTASVTVDLVRRGSQDGCGCFGALSRTPAGMLGVLRTLLLTADAIVAAGVPHSGIRVLTRLGGGSLTALSVQIALFVVMSPELAGAVSRIGRTVPCEVRDVPPAVTHATLRASRAWQAYAGVLTSAEPVETWRELCLRYVVYPAEIEGRPAHVVFAVPIGGRRTFVRAGIAWDRPRHDEGSPVRRVPSRA